MAMMYVTYYQMVQDTLCVCVESMGTNNRGKRVKC